MGMLMAMTMMEQEEAARKAAETAEQTVPDVKDEEIPFAEPPVEEPAKEQEKKPVTRKPAATTRRRKTVK